MGNAQTTNDVQAEVTSSSPTGRKLMLDGNELKEIDGNGIIQLIKKTANMLTSVGLDWKAFEARSLRKNHDSKTAATAKHDEESSVHYQQQKARENTMMAFAASSSTTPSDTCRWREPEGSAGMVCNASNARE